MTAATRNGTTDAARKLEAAVFPLDTFKDAAPHLRRPFTAAAVKFKMQATWPKGAPTGGLVVCYIDARLVVERLNLIIPHLWSDAYGPSGKDLVCALTVDGITRYDIGQEQGGPKGLYSDALKRAAVKFGVGVSLYAVPKMMVNVGDHAKAKQSTKGPTLELTPNGETKMRDLYAAWLDVRGIEAFGPALDHGDVEGAQGDIEADDESSAAEAPPAAPVPEAPVAPTFVLAKEIVDELVAAKKATGKDDEWVRQQLVAVGLSSVPAGNVTIATIKGLTEQQAMRLLERFEGVTEAQDAAAQTATETGE